MIDFNTADEFVLSDYPRELKVRDVRLLLSQNDLPSKECLAEVIYHRLYRRYVVPMQNISPSFKSGFLIMASSCLLIEAFQAFREGLEYTKERGAGEERFLKFFNEIDGFQSLAPHAHDFYVNIRCGILHQAETYQGWRVRRDGPFFDPISKVINANAFWDALGHSVDNYCKRLKVSDWNTDEWKSARRKLGFVCDHCVPGHK
jgi:hypothetical protein